MSSGPLTSYFMRIFQLSPNNPLTLLHSRIWTRHIVPEVAPQVIKKQNNISWSADCDTVSTAQDAVCLHLRANRWPVFIVVPARTTGPLLESCFPQHALVLYKLVQDFALVFAELREFLLPTLFFSMSWQPCIPVYQVLTFLPVCKS